MKCSEFIEECLLGGPGLRGYDYQCDVYCEYCADDIVRSIAGNIAPKIESTDDWLFRDSESVPQPIFFGESDYAQHCAKCGEYLYGPQLEAEGGAR